MPSLKTNKSEILYRAFTGSGILLLLLSFGLLFLVYFSPKNTEESAAFGKESRELLLLLSEIKTLNLQVSSAESEVVYADNQYALKKNAVRFFALHRLDSSAEKSIKKLQKTLTELCRLPYKNKNSADELHRQTAKLSNEISLKLKTALQNFEDKQAERSQFGDRIKIILILLIISIIASDFFLILRPLAPDNSLFLRMLNRLKKGNKKEVEQFLAEQSRLEQSLQESRATEEELKQQTEEMDAVNRMLSDSEKQLSTLYDFQESVLNHTSQLIFSTDIDGVFTSVNAAVEKVLFYKKNELIGKCEPTIWLLPDELASRAEDLAKEYARPISSDNIDALFYTCRYEKITESREWTAVRKNGNRISIRLTVNPIYDKEGQLTGYTGIGEDISELRLESDRRNRLANIIEAFPGMVSVTDLEQNSTYLNEAGRQILGYGLNEKISVNRLYSDEQKRFIIDKCRSQGPDRGTEIGESQMLRFDGSTLPVFQIGIGHFNKKGKMNRISVISIDITARKFAEAELHKTHLENRHLSDALNSSSVVLTADSDGNLLTFNTIFSEMSGYGPDFIGKNVFRFLQSAHEDRPLTPDILKNRDSRKIWRGELRNKAKNRQLFWTDTFIHTLEDEKSGKIRFMIVMVPITDKKLAEQKKQDLSELYELAVTGSGAGVWSWVPSREPRNLWSSRFYTLLGYENQEFKPTFKRFSAHLHPAESKKLLEEIKLFSLTNGTFQKEIRLLTKSGGFKWFVASVILRRNSAGQVVKAVASIIDINERKLAESHAREAAKSMKLNNKALGKAYTDLEQSLDNERAQKERTEVVLQKLKTTQTRLVESEKMAGLGQLTAGIAHEINNPINFVYAGSDTLRELINEVKPVWDSFEGLLGLPAEEITKKLAEIEDLKTAVEYDESRRSIDELLKDIRTGAERTAEIVKGLRTFSRLDEESVKQINLHDNIDSTLVLLRNRYKGKTVVERDFADDLPRLECLPGQINQVLMNIMANALDAVKKDGKIEISSRYIPDSDQICIGIKDNGCGMDEDTVSKIFEPFFTTKDVGSGTGLGLAISHGIIERHQGKIRVESRPGEGTEFLIYLPRIADIIENKK